MQPEYKTLMQHVYHNIIWYLFCKDIAMNRCQSRVVLMKQNNSPVSLLWIAMSVAKYTNVATVDMLHLLLAIL